MARMSWVRILGNRFSREALWLGALPLAAWTGQLFAEPAGTTPSMPAAALPAAQRPSSSPQRVATGLGKKNASKPDASQPEVLLLDVTVNRQRLAEVVRVEQWPGGALLLPVEAWTEARLAPLPQRSALRDGTPAYALEAVPGATYRLDRLGLALEISAPAEAFVGSALTLQDAQTLAPPRPQPGFLFNYDLSVAHGTGVSLAGGALLEAVAFGRFGHLVSSALARDDGRRRSFTRLDTFWRYDLPHRLETLVLGDTVGVGGGWSQPVRYAGVHWGRDFGMRPGFVTLPQVTLAGEAALPSTVEVLVNNARRMSQPVPPGPFELRNVPTITGAGDINLVVRDLLGRETVVRQSYYTSPRLLAPGLTDFSFDAGWLRTGYGDSSAYGSGFGAATWRQGLSASLTGEARLELQAQRRAAGLELAGLLGQWAVGRVALAASSGSSQGVPERGQLLQLGIERSTPNAGGALQYEHASRGFAPFGEATGAEAMAQRARTRWLASLGGYLGGALSGGVSYVQQTRWDGDRVQSLGLSASWPLWPRASLGLSINKRLDGDRAWGASAVVSVPLESGIHTALRLDRTPGLPPSGTVSASRNAPAGPGLGWRVETSTQDSRRASASLQGNTSQAEWTLDMAGAQGQLATRAGARGTLGLLGGLPFASRAVGQDGFAVVEVGGLAGVPVMRSHQVVATTDARGLALVPGLLAWQKNQIEIDPADLPLDVELGTLVQQVTPYPASGSVVRFAVRRTRQALVVLHQPDGQPVPVGTRVRLEPGGPEFIAGRRGEVWLTDLAAARQRLQVRWPGGGCQLEFTVPAADGAPGKVGPLACAKD
jgi:outer membrane usher protein